MERLGDHRNFAERPAQFMRRRSGVVLPVKAMAAADPLKLLTGRDATKPVLVVFAVAEFRVPRPHLGKDLSSEHRRGG